AYASTTHWTSVMVACRSACNAGSATLTTVPSMNVIADARIVAISVQRRFSAAVIPSLPWVCGGAVGCVVRRGAVLLDIIAEVVVRVPATRRRGRNTSPRRGMKALGTGAGSEPPGRFSGLDRQKHCVPSHLG